MNQRKEIVITNFDDFKKLYNTLEQDNRFNIVFTYPVGKDEITVTCPLYVGLEAAYSWFTKHRLIAEKSLYICISPIAALNINNKDHNCHHIFTCKEE